MAAGLMVGGGVRTPPSTPRAAAQKFGEIRERIASPGPTRYAGLSPMETSVARHKDEEIALQEEEERLEEAKKRLEEEEERLQEEEKNLADEEDQVNQEEQTVKEKEEDLEKATDVSEKIKKMTKDLIESNRRWIKEKRGRIKEAQGRIEETRGRIEAARRWIEAARGRIEEARGRIEAERGRIEETQRRIEAERRESHAFRRSGSQSLSSWWNKVCRDLSEKGVDEILDGFVKEEDINMDEMETLFEHVLVSVRDMTYSIRGSENYQGFPPDVEKKARDAGVKGYKFEEVVYHPALWFMLNEMMERRKVRDLVVRHECVNQTTKRRPDFSATFAHDAEFSEMTGAWEGEAKIESTLGLPISLAQLASYVIGRNSSQHVGRFGKQRTCSIGFLFSWRKIQFFRSDITASDEWTTAQSPVLELFSDEVEHSETPRASEGFKALYKLVVGGKSNVLTSDVPPLELFHFKSGDDVCEITLEERIGRGGYSDVYKYKTTDGSSWECVKIARSGSGENPEEETCAHLVTEAKVLQRLEGVDPQHLPEVGELSYSAKHLSLNMVGHSLRHLLDLFYSSEDTEEAGLQAIEEAAFEEEKEEEGGVDFLEEDNKDGRVSTDGLTAAAEEVEEEQAREKKRLEVVGTILTQIIQTIKKVHNKGIAHLDLRHNNLIWFYDNEEDDPRLPTRWQDVDTTKIRIAIIDWGLAMPIGKRCYRTGNPSFQPVAFFQKKYLLCDSKFDLETIVYLAVALACSNLGRVSIATPWILDGQGDCSPRQEFFERGPRREFLNMAMHGEYEAMIEFVADTTNLKDLIDRKSDYTA